MWPESRWNRRRTPDSICRQKTRCTAVVWPFSLAIYRQTFRKGNTKRYWLIYSRNVSITKLLKRSSLFKLIVNITKKLIQTLNRLPAYKFKQCGPIYYEYGSLIITYDNADIAVKAFYMLRESSYDDKNLLVLLLPNISPNMIQTGVRPLLVFVNVKSGGCQGLELITAFRKLLNPYQVYDLDNGGPLLGYDHRLISLLI